MAALTTPTAQQLREFYPISASIPGTTIEEWANYVKNHIFLKMFGYEAASQIIAGTIEDNASATFIGFQKFLALCCAYVGVKDPLVSTNFGAKVIDRPGVINPTNNQKSITLIDIENTISIHYRAAWGYIATTTCGKGLPNWDGGYFSYKTSRL